MNVLTITNKSGEAVVSLHIADVDPPTATIAILNALAALPTPRKPRRDKGKARATTTGGPAA